MKNALKKALKNLKKDRIGVYVDADSSSEDAIVLNFFLNGEFNPAAISVKNVPRARPLFPALSMQGFGGADCSFMVSDVGLILPNVEKHAANEQAFIVKKEENFGNLLIIW